MTIVNAKPVVLYR